MQEDQLSEHSTFQSEEPGITPEKVVVVHMPWMKWTTNRPGPSLSSLAKKFQLCLWISTFRSYGIEHDFHPITVSTTGLYSASDKCADHRWYAMDLWQALIDKLYVLSLSYFCMLKLSFSVEEWKATAFGDQNGESIGDARFQKLMRLPQMQHLFNTGVNNYFISYISLRVESTFRYICRTRPEFISRLADRKLQSERLPE